MMSHDWEGSHDFSDRYVAEAFAAFPKAERRGALSLRDLIFTIAAETPGVGKVQETLKWGQPAYLTPETKSGSTLRLGLPKDGGFALYTNCRTRLISDFQALFPNDFSYEGNRAIRFQANQTLAAGKISLLIRAALTYHLK